MFGNQPFIADMTAFALRADLPTAGLMRKAYKRRAAVFSQRLGVVPGLCPYVPHAGMFVIVDVAETGMNGESFAWRLLDAGVAVMPGSSFGANADPLIRLSLTVPDTAIETACERIASFVMGL